jgi:hypothetical protein
LQPKEKSEDHKQYGSRWKDGSFKSESIDIILSIVLAKTIRRRLKEVKIDKSGFFL